MAKLYFKYGAMGSSKTAQVLITKFNYEERNMKVWLIKPSTDNRDEADVIKSRIGLFARGNIIYPDTNIIEEFKKHGKADVIIADECQFLTEAQIDQLRDIVDDMDVPVLCFGLRTDFLTKAFTGSLRLFEVADSITEIKPSANAAPRRLSTPEWTTAETYLPTGRRYASAETTDISPCATSAGKRQSRDRKAAFRAI